MKNIGLLISKYLLTAILPYFAFSWLLLSVVLFVQQAGRFSDIFFSVNIPSNLVWQLTVALIPNVIAFTCPMAILVGTIIGLTKMQGDSELVAIRASGVGNLQIAVPIMILGVLLSAFAFFVNLKGVPLAAGLVRSVALQTAIKKLESPIEPGVFNTEVAGYTIYVKGGDFETGRWRNIFIYNEDKANGAVRLITSQNGRIDTEGQASELVLENASVTTLPLSPGEGKYVSENIGEIRLSIRTRRGELVEKLTGSQVSPEELGLQDLAAYADAKDGKERVEANLLWQRRLLLSITPLIFCLLGTVIVLRFNRGGRGFGIAVALMTLIGFYLLAFLGEQLARTGAIGAISGSLLPIVGSLAAVLWFSMSRRIDFWRGIGDRIYAAWERLRSREGKPQSRNFFVDLTTGLRDFDLIRNLVKNFLLTLSFLTAIFIIFTAFELWKFAGRIDGGVVLLAKYLFYLLPFVYLQIAPSAAMVAVIATYVIKSRQNEIVTWASAGQSVYRLLAPCLLLTLVLGAFNLAVQEKVLPRANQLQDATRNLIRSEGLPENKSGKHWVASENRIYSFELPQDPTSNAELTSPRPVDELELVFPPSGKLGVPPLGGQRVELRTAPIDEQTIASDNESLFRVPHSGGLRIEPKAALIYGDTVASDNESQFVVPPLGGKSSDSKAAPTDREIAASDNEKGSGCVGGSGTVASIDGTCFKQKIPGFQVPFLLIAPPTLSLFVSASDNEKRDTPKAVATHFTIYEFANNAPNLQAVYRSERASWSGGEIKLEGEIEKDSLKEGKIVKETVSGIEFPEPSNPFVELDLKPSHLNTTELRRRMETAGSDTDRQNLAVALEKKYAAFFIPLVLALFTAPFSLRLGRRGNASAVGYAVGLWLLFTGTSSVFEQLGLSGMLSPVIAIWSPLAIFALVGVYLLSRVRT